MPTMTDVAKRAGVSIATGASHDSAALDALDPLISSVDQPVYDIGTKATELLLRKNSAAIAASGTRVAAPPTSHPLLGVVPRCC